MALWRASTTKFEWLPDVPTDFAPSMPWKPLSITTWDDYPNPNLPTDSAEEAEEVAPDVDHHIDRPGLG